MRSKARFRGKSATNLQHMISDPQGEVIDIDLNGKQPMIDNLDYG